ncbi:MAG: ABC transporter ATP-binding protein, partial [Herminiimonas sp.]|nr:ABC transporter ATP-binding protein [Herminiimonas sp.]
DYEGTVFLVSHDRTFLDNVVTQVIVAEGEGGWREYIGGYSDWERVRPSQPAGGKGDGKAVAAAANSTSASKASASTSTLSAAVTPAAAIVAKAKKLSFKEQRDLDALPLLLAQLEAEQAQISQRLADPALYKQSAGDVQKLHARYAQLDTELTQTLEKWETIEARGKA